MTDGPDPERSLRVLVVGGGPAGLMAAETIAVGLDGRGTVLVVDQMPSVGRKFLMAGRGGLNLTHGEPLEAFLGRYRGGGERLTRLVRAFPPEALRAWCEGLGQDIFVGSSGRVFPLAFKSSPLLRAWLTRLAGLGVGFRLRTRWLGFDDAGRPMLAGPGGEGPLAVDAIVLALGGASWPRLGSDGHWTGILGRDGISLAPLRPANVGFRVGWSAHMREAFAGVPLKGVRLTGGGGSVLGEAVVTATGLEGGALYALSGALRDACERDGGTELIVDLKPDVPFERVRERLSRARPGQSASNLLRKALSLQPVAVALMREAAGPSLPLDGHDLAGLVKNVRLRLDGPQGLERAISSAGGVAFEEIDDRLMLRSRPGTFVAGEMLDWEAPTGGYLLQACFATGVAAGRGVLDWLRG
jgi:uncharacterized flavoprotein (TIGR03862 family)